MLLQSITIKCETYGAAGLPDSVPTTKQLSASESQPHDVCDFANLPAIHAAMERAHGQLLGFHLIVPQTNHSDEAIVDNLVTSDSPRTDGAHVTKQAGVGQIPRMPRPKFLSALAQFALGE